VGSTHQLPDEIIPTSQLLSSMLLSLRSRAVGRWIWRTLVQFLWMDAVQSVCVLRQLSLSQPCKFVNLQICKFSNLRGMSYLCLMKLKQIGRWIWRTLMQLSLLQLCKFVHLHICMGSDILLFYGTKFTVLYWDHHRRMSDQLQCVSCENQQLLGFSCLDCSSGSSFAKYFRFSRVCKHVTLPFRQFLTQRGKFLWKGSERSDRQVAVCFADDQIIPIRELMKDWVE
jgi:hypothetical protein